MTPTQPPTTWPFPRNVWRNGKLVMIRPRKRPATPPLPAAPF